MASIIDSFQLTFRDFETPNLPSSGPRKVWKADARALGGVIEQAVNLIANGVVIGSATLYATKAAMDADYATGAVGRLALVYADSTAANNKIWVKGASAWVDAGMTLAASAVAQLADFSARIAALEAIAGLFPYAVADAAGTVDALILNPTPALPSLKVGSFVYFRVNGPNTGAVTINVSGLGVKDLRGMTGGSLVANDLQAGRVYAARYTGTRWDLVTGALGAYSAASVGLSQPRRITLDPAATGDLIIGTTSGPAITPTDLLSNNGLLIYVPAAVNTGAVLARINGDTTDRPVRDMNNGSLVAGDFQVGKLYLFVADGGARWRCLNPGAGVVRASDIPAAVAAAVAALLGGASTSGDTLKKLEDRIASEVVTRGLNDSGLQGQITPLANKLAGIATAATANSTDAQLRDRGTHTGVQEISTVSGLQGALDGKAAAAHSHGAATTNAAGFMASADKAKLDAVEAGADVTDAQNVAAAIANSPPKTSPADSDILALLDAATGFVMGRISWASLRARIGEAFDTRTNLLAGSVKANPAAGDRFPILDSQNSSAIGYFTWTGLLAAIQSGLNLVFQGRKTVLDQTTAAFTTEKDTLYSAAAGNATAALAAITPLSDMKGRAFARPGDAPALFSNQTAGKAVALPPPAFGVKETTTALGSYWRIRPEDIDDQTGWRDLVQATDFEIEDGRTYLVSTRYVRLANPSTAQPVKLRWFNLNGNGNAISDVDLKTDPNPVTSQGPRSLFAFIGKDGAPIPTGMTALDYTIAPTAVYGRAGTRIISNGQSTGVISLFVKDVTDDITGGLDITSLIARVTAVEALAGVVPFAVVDGSGTADTLVINPTPALASLRVGALIYFRVLAANTASPTLNVSNLGAKDLRGQGDTALTADDLQPGRVYSARYSGSRWVLMSGATGLYTAREPSIAQTRRLALAANTEANVIIGTTSGLPISDTDLRNNNARLIYVPTIENTGPVVARINGDTFDRSVTDMNGAALRAGDFQVGKRYELIADGPRYCCLNPGAGTPRQADILSNAALLDALFRNRILARPAEEPHTWTYQPTIAPATAGKVLDGGPNFVIAPTVRGRGLAITGANGAGPIGLDYIVPGRVYRVRMGVIRLVDDVAFNRANLRVRAFDKDLVGISTLQLGETHIISVADGFQEYATTISTDATKAEVALPAGTVAVRRYAANGQGVTNGVLAVLYVAVDDITDGGFASATPVADPANLDFFTRDAGGAPRTLSSADLEAWIKQMAAGPDLYPHDIVKETIGTTGRVIIPSAPEVYSVFIQNLSEDSDAEIGIVDGDKSIAAMSDAKWRIGRLGYIEAESPNDFVPGAFSIISNKDGARFSCHFTTTTPDNPIFTAGAAQAAEEHLARYSGSMTTAQQTAIRNRFRTLWLLGIIQKARAAGATLLTARAPNLTDSLLDWARPGAIASAFGSPTHVPWSNWAFDGTDDYIETNVGFSAGVTPGDHTGYVEIGPETHTSAQIAAGSQRLRFSLNHLNGTRMRITDFSANMAGSGQAYADIYYNPEHTAGGGGHVFASRNDAINTIATHKKADFVVSSPLDYTDAYTFKLGAGSSTNNAAVSFWPGPVYGGGLLPFLTKTQRDGLVDADAAFVAALAGA
ncbi:hypothetical protein [Methylopila sp. Yamaguchi]|uniref:hypothetical protein n=1 Tax=Methylopila sp. Yamaguchi TaxID=1437817 RepID=UPI000CC40DA7|nr:hypothetical protein [Methylopila sp. Yamaguchi]GBD48110.1 hypothetical protein METY_1323 [Methylopila sp. Yamaguchi]